MASIKGKTIPEWRERQLLHPYITRVSVNTTSPNRKELRGHIARAGRIVPDSDERRLGESPAQARISEAVRNAVALGFRKYEGI